MDLLWQDDCPVLTRYFDGFIKLKTKIQFSSFWPKYLGAIAVLTVEYTHR
jgi:hypothetical protein